MGVGLVQCVGEWVIISMCVVVIGFLFVDMQWQVCGGFSQCLYCGEYGSDGFCGFGVYELF